MKQTFPDKFADQTGSAGAKLLIVLVILVLVGHAGYNYVPVAYEGATLKESLDTAVIKGVTVSGNAKPVDVVTSAVQRALVDHNAPADSWVEIKPVSGVVQAHVIYRKPINILPFGIYKYNYDFNHLAYPRDYVGK